MLLLIQTLNDWFWSFSPILLPGGLILAMWISLSHRREFALSWHEKLLRLIMFVGIVVLVALLVFFVVGLGQKTYGWDDTVVRARCPVDEDPQFLEPASALHFAFIW